MFKKIVMMMLVGGFGMMVLAGCSLKSSRRFIEGKAAELSKVYPTENLEDLFKKFPDGFQIDVMDAENLDEDERTSSIIYHLILNGISETREIKGKYTKEKAFKNSSGKIEHEMLYQGEVYYKGGSLHLSDDTDANNKEKGDLKHTRLLMQDFPISRSSLKGLEVVRKGYSLETGSASITYKLKNEQVNDYLGLEKDDQINMDINIFEPTISGKSYGYTVIFRKNDIDHTEMITGKLEGYEQ